MGRLYQCIGGIGCCHQLSAYALTAFILLLSAMLKSV